MCVQCMMGATSAVAAGGGMRVWLRAWSPAWLTPQRMHRVTIAIGVAVVVASSVLMSGSGAPAAHG